MIYIWVRATIDWSDETAFNAQIPDGFAEKVELWNRTFSIPYHLFRHRVRQIAQQNHSRIEGVSLAAWDDIPDGALVVPVDDDDWFSPSLGVALATSRDDSISGYYWPGKFLEIPIDWRHEMGKALRACIPFVGPKWFCNTNNYAMVKTPSAKPLLYKHVLASTWFKANRSARAKRIDQCMSIMNRTIASQTSLAYKRPPFTQRRIQLSYSRYRKLYRRPLKSELKWAEPYQAMMSDLMDDLRLQDSHSTAAN
jgi:hypothetical protein